MDIHVPHIIIECTAADTNNQAVNSSEAEEYNGNRLSMFTSDLLMWSPNSSNHNSFIELQDSASSVKSAVDQPSPANSVPHTFTSDLSVPTRYSTSADSGYHETYPPHNDYIYDAPSVPLETIAFGAVITSNYGYSHRHPSDVVDCILCGLESYRKFQVRMGWPHHTECPDYEGFSMTLPDLTLTKYCKIHLHLTTEDKQFQQARSQQYCSRAVMSNEKNHTLDSREFIRRIRRRMHRFISRLRGSLE